MDDLDQLLADADRRAKASMTRTQYRWYRYHKRVMRQRATARFRWQQTVGAAVSVLQKLCRHDLAYLPELTDDSVVMSVCEFCGHVDIDVDTDHAEQVAEARKIAAEHEEGKLNP